MERVRCQSSRQPSSFDTSIAQLNETRTDVRRDWGRGAYAENIYLDGEGRHKPATAQSARATDFGGKEKRRGGGRCSLFSFAISPCLRVVQKRHKRAPWRWTGATRFLRHEQPILLYSDSDNWLRCWLSSSDCVNITKPGTNISVVIVQLKWNPIRR